LPIEVIFPSAQAIEFAAGKEGMMQLLNTVTFCRSQLVMKMTENTIYNIITRVTFFIQFATGK
jgi:hypothetical protein